MLLDCWSGKKVSLVSSQGTRCATGCLRRGCQSRSVASGPRGGSLGSACAIGAESKVWFLGIVGHAWARATAPDCVENIDTSGLDSWIIGQLCRREGVACVAAAELKGKVAKSGVVWRGLVASPPRPSVDKFNTIPLKSLKVGHFPEKEGGWCCERLRHADPPHTLTPSATTRHQELGLDVPGSGVKLAFGEADPLGAQA